MPRYIRYYEEGQWKYASVKDVGDISQLKTSNKSDVVSAINELIDGGIAEELKQVQDDIKNQAETIKSAQDLISTISGQVTSLSGKEEELRGKVGTIEGKVTQNIEDYKNIKKDLETKVDSQKYQEEYAEIVGQLQDKANSIDVQGIVDDVNRDIAEVQQVADSAKTDAIKLNEKVGQTKQEILVNIESTKTAIQGDLDKAKQELNGSITDLKGLSEQAKKDITELNTKVDTKVNEINQSAKTLGEKVDKVDQAVSGVKGEVTTVKSEVDKVKGEVSSTITNINNLGDRVTLTETGITQNKEAIQSKVEKLDYEKDVNGIKTRVENAESTLTQHAGLIESKVKKEDFNALTGRVGTAETKLSQTEEAIKLKAEKTEVENSLKGKVDNSTFNNKVAEIKLTTDGIEQTVANTKKTIDSQGTKISEHEAKIIQNAEGIESKANKKDVYTKGESDTQVSSLQTQITQNAEGIKLKAEKSVVDSLSKSIAETKSELVVQSEKIASKVEKKDYDELEGVVTNQTSQIEQLSDQISQKVGYSDYNELTQEVSVQETQILQTKSDIQLIAKKSEETDGRLTSAESSIKQNAESIGLKAEKKDVDKALEGKVGNTTFNDKVAEIKLTTDGIKQEVANTKAEVDTAKGNITTMKTDMSKIDQKADSIKQSVTSLETKTTAQGEQITKHESSINTMKGQISLTATKEDVKKDINTEIDKAKAEIKVTTEGITQEVSKTNTKIDNISIGGRNLLIEKSDERILPPRNTGQATDNSNYTTLPAEMELGQEYTVSANVKFDTELTANEITVYPYPKGVAVRVPIVNGRIVHTFKKEIADVISVLLYAGKAGSTKGIGVTFTKMKIEKGNKATDYTEAPENTKTAIGEVSQQVSKVEQKANSIETTVKSVQGDLSTLGQKMTTAETKIAQTEKAIALKAEKSVVDDMGKQVSQNKSQIEVQAGQISQKVSSVEFEEAIGLNKWIASRYDITGTDLRNTPPSFPLIQGVKPTEVKEYADAQNLVAFPNTDNVITHYFTNVYLKARKTVNLSVKNDDSVAIYMNGAKIYESKYNLTATKVSLGFNAGWNTVEILHGEQSGAETCDIGVKLSTQVDKLTAHIGVGDKDDTRLIEAETSIKQTKDAIDLKADKTVVTELGNKVESNTASLKVANDAIKSKVEKTEFDAYSDKVRKAESSISQLSESITQKVEKKEYDSLNNIVKDNSTKIEQLTDSIELKVDQQDFNGMNDRVTDSEVAISLNTDQILLKAEKEELDKATGRIATAEGQIKVMSDEISLTVKKKDFDAVNKSVTDSISQIKQDAQGIKQSVTETNSKLDGLQIGSRNYIAKGAEEVVLENNVLGQSKGTQKALVPDALQDLRNSEIVLSFYAKTTNLVHGTSGSNSVGIELSLVFEDGTQAWYELCYKKVVPIGSTSGYVRYDAISANRKHKVADKPIKSGYLNTLLRDATGKIQIKSIQLERGNKLTDFSVAQEDLTGSISEVSEKTSKVEQTASSIKQSVDTVSKIVTDQGTKLASQQTAIETMNKAINLKAEATNVYSKAEADGKTKTAVDNAKGEIKLETDKIALNVTNLTKTVAEQGTTISNHETSITQMKGDINLRAEKKDVYTKTESDGKINTAVTNAKAEIKITTDSITQNVTNVKGDLSNLNDVVVAQGTQIKQTSDEVAINVVKKGNIKASINASTEGIKIGGQHVDITGQVTFQSLDPTMQGKVNAGTDAKNSVDNLSVGGRNILFNTGNFNDTTGWVLNSGTSIAVVNKDGFNVIKGVGSYMQTANKTKLKPDTEYVYSGEIMFEQDFPINDANPLHCWVANGGASHSVPKTVVSKDKVVKANTWTRIVIRFKTLATGETTFTPIIYTGSTMNADKVVSYLKNIQLEEGNVATTWQPAPEDVQANIDNITIGGNNIISNSHADYSTTDYLIATYTLTENWVAGQEYTFVIKGTVPAGQKFGIWMNGGSNNVGYATTKYVDGVTYVTFKAVTPAGSHTKSLSLYNYPQNTTACTVDWVALYRGNKPMDWQISSGDVQNLFTGADEKAEASKRAIADMSNDNKATSIEKQQLKKEWATITAEKPNYEALATTYGITTEKTNYVNAYNALNTAITPIIANTTVTSDINGATFRATFDDYYDKKSQLIKKINELARSIGTGADSKAQQADAKAQQAKDSIADMSSDSKITPVEKVQLAKEWAVMVAEKPQYEALSTTYGITTEKTNYVNAYNTLNTVLNGTGGILTSMTTTSAVTGATFRGQFDDYYDKKAQLVKAINTKAKSLADSAQGTANGVNNTIKPWIFPNKTTINGAQIETGSVKAVQIDVNNLFANTAFINNLKSQNVSADKLVGGVIKGIRYESINPSNSTIKLVLEGNTVKSYGAMSGGKQNYAEMKEGGLSVFEMAESGSPFGDKKAYLEPARFNAVQGSRSSALEPTELRFWVPNMIGRVSYDVTPKNDSGYGLRLEALGGVHIKSFNNSKAALSFDAQGAMWFDGWGNLWGDEYGSQNSTWSVKDGSGRVKLILPVGKDGTGSNDYHAHVGGHKFFHNGNLGVAVWTKGSSEALLQFAGNANFKYWSGGNYFECKNQADNGFIPIYASSFNTASSLVWKTDIESYKKSALDVVMETNIVTYKYKSDVEESNNPQTHVGVIAEYAPKEIQSKDGRGVDNYAMSSLAWKAIQELSEQVRYLKEKLNNR
ncbi:TPA: tail fiber domain-containing protein [Bacillus cereus]